MLLENQKLKICVDYRNQQEKQEIPKCSFKKLYRNYDRERELTE